MNHQIQEVFKVASGLAEDREVLLSFLYTELLEYFKRQTDIPTYMFDYEASFLKSLMKEIDINFDPLHNEYINYVTENDTKIFVPSKVYIFGPNVQSDKVKFDTKWVSLEPSTAECLMKLENEDASEVLKILQKIGSYNQDVSISYLDWRGVMLPNHADIDKLAKETLKISPKIASICTYTCQIPPPVYEHMVSQLGQCDKLQKLDLGGSFSMDIAKAIAASTSLKEFYLYECKIPHEVFKDIVQQLQKHTGLEKLRLNYTKGIPRELGNVLFKLVCLKEFYAKECKMSAVSVGSVLTGLANCHDLQDLRLVGNNLTNCLRNLFPVNSGSGLEFKYLRRLLINETNLSRDDLQVLARSFHCNRLPQLVDLDLSGNELTGTLRSLLCGPNHPGFPNLRFLVLKRTRLNEDDLVSVHEVVYQKRMPQLRSLCLEENNLSKMMSEVKNIIEVCTMIYEKLKLVIRLPPVSYVNQMKAICKGTVVCINHGLLRDDKRK